MHLSQQPRSGAGRALVWTVGAAVAMSSVAILFGAIARAAPIHRGLTGPGPSLSLAPIRTERSATRLNSSCRQGRRAPRRKRIPGQPGWLQLDGKILDDGSADLYATGLVGAARSRWTTPCRHPYGYHLAAQFSVSSATGTGRGAPLHRGFLAQPVTLQALRSSAVSVISGTPASALESGQSALAFALSSENSPRRSRVRSLRASGRCVRSRNHRPS